MIRGRRSARALSTDVALLGLLCAFKLGIDACVLHVGFSHVSDDDYARTVIAEQFAYAPRLDPSATSWLPLPFWIVGGAMRVLGRSLEAARIVAIAIGALGVVPPYVAMRAARVSRATALAATLVAMSLPWNAWLGAATVPDGWTAGLIAAAAIAMHRDGARPWCAVALLAASLARYEAWAACAILAIVSGIRAARSGERRIVWREVGCALVALAGPALWMAWNAHAHGSAFHFMARVSAFRRTIGAADVPFRDKLLGYPRAFLSDTPEAAALGACGMAGLWASAQIRSRWSGAAIVALAVLAFLVAGDLGDGAPTHHPARALIAVVWVCVGMGIDATARAIASRRAQASRWVSGLAAASIAVLWVDSLPARWTMAPGEGDSDRRDPQIARGLELRRREAGSADVTPCQFEHFALIAAWGAPERVHVNARTGGAITTACPQVNVR